MGEIIEFTGHKRKRLIFRSVRILVGSAFLLVGIAGLIYPVLQGWLFAAVGALLLSHDVPFIRRLLNWLAFHFPSVGKAGNRFRNAVFRTIRLIR